MLIPVLILISAQVTSRGGNANEIQARIDQATAGSTVRVPRGYWGPIVIDKPIALIGDDGATIFREEFFGGDPFPAPITLAGPGRGKVTLTNLRVEGRVDGHVFGSVAGGIVGGGFDILEVVGCHVEAPSYWRWHLACRGGPGVSVSGVELLVVRNSLVLASTGHHDHCAWGPAAPGIVGSRVELWNSAAIAAPFLEPCMRDICADEAIKAQGAVPGVLGLCVISKRSASVGSTGQNWRRFVSTSSDYYGGYFEDCGVGPDGPSYGHCPD